MHGLQWDYSFPRSPHGDLNSATVCINGHHLIMNSECVRAKCRDSYQEEIEESEL